MNTSRAVLSSHGSNTGNDHLFESLLQQLEASQRASRSYEHARPWPKGENLRREVAQRAYLIFLRRGASHGSDLDDWLEAERQVWADSGSIENKMA